MGPCWYPLCFIITMGDLLFQPKSDATESIDAGTKINTFCDLKAASDREKGRNCVRTVVAGLLLLSAAPVQAYTYYYTGVSNTAKVAYASLARLRMDAVPKCLKGKCHALAWTALWDAGAGHSNQYVEVGIGHSPRTCPKNAPVKLWWASPQVPGGATVNCVPKGTEVIVTAQREDGKEGVLATWEWPGGRISHWVDTPGWSVGPGVHPTKIEVYSYYDSVTPRPISLSVADVLIYEQDIDAFLQQTAPYYAAPGSSLTSFAVNY